MLICVSMCVHSHMNIILLKLFNARFTYRIHTYIGEKCSRAINWKKTTETKKKFWLYLPRVHTFCVYVCVCVSQFDPCSLLRQNLSILSAKKFYVVCLYSTLESISLTANLLTRFVLEEFHFSISHKFDLHHVFSISLRSLSTLFFFVGITGKGKKKSMSLFVMSTLRH